MQCVVALRGLAEINRDAVLLPSFQAQPQRDHGLMSRRPCPSKTRATNERQNSHTKCEQKSDKSRTYETLRRLLQIPTQAFAFARAVVHFIVLPTLWRYERGGSKP